MKGPVLHLLSQRPGQTGSGVMLESIVTEARAAGWEQAVLLGLPGQMESYSMGGLPARNLRALRFDSKALPFALPGMSDIMPYPSSRFSELSESRLSSYMQAWRREIAAAIAEFSPRLIHSNHVWLLSSLVKDLAPDIPVMTNCHATGLRQAELCPQLAPRVRLGCRRNERFGVLHAGHAARLASDLDLDPRRIRITGAGYREDLFHARGATDRNIGDLLYVGKFSAAKGLPQLLDALELLAESHPDLQLHVAGGGGGEEGAALAARMKAMGPRLKLHGMLDQGELAKLMRRVGVCVLPSYFEGLPLVLVEAAACGCRLVATALPGIESVLAPVLGEDLKLIAPPSMAGVDRPEPAALPEFTSRLATCLAQQLAAPPLDRSPESTAARLSPFTWSTVFRKIETVWRELLDAETTA
jgi:glycosyltransferase involved in cell wall biosynthesis